MTLEEQEKEFGSITRLRHAIAAVESHHQDGGVPTIRHLIEPIGTEASVLAAMVIVLPFLSPVSMGPLTIPASLLVAILALQLLRRQEGSPLPNRLLALHIPPGLWRAMDAVLSRVERGLRRFSSPRLRPLVQGDVGRWVCGGGIIVGAFLLAIPIPFLPLTNTLPSFGILCFGFGWMERDGVLTVTGAASLLLTLVIFGALGFAIYYFGAEAVEAVWPFGS